MLLAAVVRAASVIPSVPSGGTISAEQLEAAVQAVEASADLDDETRATVIDYLRDAQAQLQNRLASEAAAAVMAGALDTAPQETRNLLQSLDQESAEAPTPADLGVDNDTPLDELQQRLVRESAELAAADAALVDLENRIDTEEDRPAQIRDRIVELRNTRTELTAAQDAPAPSGEAETLTDARRLVTELKISAAAAELDRLDKELLSHGVRLDLIRAQRDAAANSREALNQRVAVLQSIVNVARQSEAVAAQQAAEEVEIAAAGAHPVVREIAEANAALTRELPTVATDIETTTSALADITERVQQIERSMTLSRQRLEVGGVNQVIGRIFVEERRNLPGVGQYREEVRERRRTLADIGLAQVRIEEQRRDLSVVDTLVNQAMLEVATDVTDEQELADIRVQVRDLLVDRKDKLARAATSYTTYMGALGDLDVAQRRLLEAADEYKEFLDQHLMWIPSASLFGLPALQALGPATAWLLSPTSWSDATLALVDSVRERPLFSLLGIALLAGVFLFRRPLARRHRGMNERVGHLSSDHIGLTVASLGITALYVLPLPLLLGAVGVALKYGPRQTEFIASVTMTMLTISPFLYNAFLFRALCADTGVARVHFGWQPENLAKIRRQFDRLIVVGVPMLVVGVMLLSSPIAAYRDSLGRLSFVAIMVIFALVIHPLADPRTGVAKAAYSKRTGSWVSRLKWLWYALAVGSPLVLALLAVAGYLYTGAILTGRLIDTIWLVLGMIVVNLVVLRWLSLARRKIALQRALEERAARKKATEEADEAAATDSEAGVAERRPLDLDAVDHQTRRLLQSGLFVVAVLAGWAIWSEILPALGIFEQVSLWSKTVTVEGVQTIAPVTLADLLLAFVLIAVTAIAARNLPGLMEIAVLQHLELPPGGRYTINTVIRYVVVTIGAIIVLNTIGWNWSQIQWLVAALTVGLGFGLQEVVANFVSGMIILFERPVRVGDTVTVGQVTGTVSRVRIRATTITDWDRKEIIVPNKSFITEQVINWTLSDPITRVVVPVGISYGSDVELATRVMSETLHNMPLVLEEPAPMVYFLGFGESSLDFKLYVYSRQLADRLPLMHTVHESILKALRENGIEIPFPQRDLHVKTVDESLSGIGRQARQDEPDVIPPPISGVPSG